MARHAARSAASDPFARGLARVRIVERLRELQPADLTRIMAAVVPYRADPPLTGYLR